MSFTFWSPIELASDASDGPVWVHAAPLKGKYKHPMAKGGVLEFTPEKIDRYAQNINNNVRGIEASINFDHNNRGPASGWVKSAETRSDGLWVLVDFTDEAREKLKKKEYRYFSSELLDQWKDEDKDVVHRDVFIGGALTNRPFLKNLLPINMSEVVETHTKEDEVNPELLRTLGLSEDATEDDVLSKVRELSAQQQPINMSEAVVEKTGDNSWTVTHPRAEGKFQVKDDDSTDLSDLPEHVRQMIESQNERVRKLEASHTLSEVTLQLGELDTDKRAIPPVVKDKLRSTLVTLDESARTAVFDALTKLAETGFVPLGEGTGRQPGKPEKSRGAQFLDDVDKYKDEHKVSYRAAFDAVSRNDREGFDIYMDEVASGDLVVEG